MSPTTRTLAVALALALSTASAPSAFSQTEAERPGDLWKESVDRLFAEWDRPDTPGAALAIVRDGRVIYERGYGMADLEHSRAIEPSTVFDGASIAKQFTGLAVAMLFTEQKIELDDPVSSYLGDEFPHLIAAIKIRHLLYHTGGLRDWPGGLMLAGVTSEDVISYRLIRQWIARQRDLNFVPGTEYNYSNTGYVLLARIVERVTGQPFPSWMTDNVFRPLGLERTRIRVDHRQPIPGMASPYTADTGRGFRRLTNNLTSVGSSSLLTTVQDLARWTIRLERPPEELRAAFALMRQRTRLANGWQPPYGFGLNLGEHRGRTAISHGGAWSGYFSELLLLPEDRLAVIVMSNTSMKTRDKSRQVADVMLDHEVREATAAVDVDPERLDDYAGHYELPSGAIISVHREGEHLMARLTGQSEYEIFPESESTFFYRIVEARITFERDENGQVHRLVLDQNDRQKPAPRIALSRNDEVRTDERIADYPGLYRWSQGNLAAVRRVGEFLLVRRGVDRKLLLRPGAGGRWDEVGDVAFADFQRDDDGTVTGLRYGGSVATRLPAPSAAMVEAMSGCYYSAELETVYRIEARDGHLVASHIRHGEIALAPTEEPDRFEGPDWFFKEVEFRRNRQEEITGLDVSADRLRNVWFERLGETCESATEAGPGTVTP